MFFNLSNSDYSWADSQSLKVFCSVFFSGVNKLDHFYKMIFIATKLFIINHLHWIYEVQEFHKLEVCMKICENCVFGWDLWLLYFDQSGNLIWVDNNKLGNCNNRLAPVFIKQSRISLHLCRVWTEVLNHSVYLSV